LIARIAIVFSLGLLLPGIATAHGGEDHSGDVAPTPSTTTSAKERTVTGQTTALEVFMTYPVPGEGEQANLRLFLSDYASNTPIAGAKISLEFVGTEAKAVMAEPTGADGIYHAIPPALQGAYPVIVTVEVGDLFDFVELTRVDLSPAHKAHSGAPNNRSSALLLFLSAGWVIALILVAFLIRDNRRRSAASLLTLGLLGLTGTALAHGGEDHGHGPTPSATEHTTDIAGATYMGKDAQFLLGVRTHQVARHQVEGRITTIGRLMPRLDGHAKIHAPVAGAILPVSGGLPMLGDRVSKGQRLAIIRHSLGAVDSGALKSDAARAEAGLREAEATRDQRVRDLARVKAMQGIVAEREIQQAALELELAQRELERARRNATIYQGGSLRRSALIAPLSGVIAETEVSMGGQVSSGQHLFTVLAPEVLWLEAEIFERDLGRLESMTGALFRVEAYAESFAARPFRFGQLVDPATHTVKAIFEVDNADGRLRPGMFADVHIGTGERSLAVTVPDAAIIEEGGRRFVFIKVSPVEFVRREVVLGARDGDLWAVEAGVAEGDRVVVQGTYQLRTTR
jgi:cobalt-zinc-cadmium efflux system membrane fusion protein